MSVAIGFASAVIVNGKIHVFYTASTLGYIPAHDGL